MARGLAVFFFSTCLLVPSVPAQPVCSPAASTKELARESALLLAAGKYRQSEQLSLCAERRAREEGNEELLPRVLNNLGAARLYQQDFLGAYGPLHEALALSHQPGMAEVEASVWSNLAAMYGMLSAWPEAGQALERALALMPADSRFRPAVMAQRIRLAARRPDLKQGEFFRLWSEAMEWAESRADWQVQRHLWDELAIHHLDAGRLEQAENAIANSFRLVVLHRLPDPDSLWMLAGRLRLAQRRPGEALEWFSRVRSRGRVQQSPVNAIRLAAFEARAEAMQHGPERALAVCRRSWLPVLEWRHAVLPDPTVELAADVAMTDLVNEYVTAAFESGGAVEAWAAVEQSRALNMLRRRKRQAASDSQEGTPEAAPGQHLTGSQAPQSGPRPAVILRAASSERPSLPLSTLPPPPPEPARLLQLVQRSLNRNQVLFTFWLSQGRSILWVITDDHFAAVLMPGREELAKAFQQLRDLIENGGHADGAAARLYDATFGRSPARSKMRAEWLISADEEPLNAPVAALRMTEGQPRWLGEARALSFLPSALWLLEPQEHRPAAGLLAIGGVIHNSADARWSAARREEAQSGGSSSSPALRRASVRELEYELPTLPGSQREVEAIAALWRQQGRQVRLMTGFEASGAAVAQALGEDWTDLHFATHVQPAPAPVSYRLASNPGSGVPAVIRFPAGEPFLALSLRTDGTREGLTERALARFRLGGARVVLNGCSTGSGPTQRGAGLSSFANAWLAAGARSVVASLWPVGDDGAFFEEYYRALLQGHRPAFALQAAQTAMIRNGAWRSQPGYWAAYIHLGKD